MSESRSEIRFFLIGLSVALLVWGILYSVAYINQEKVVRELSSNVEMMGIRIDVFETLIKEVGADQRMLLTYVITLRESLAKTGFKVPPMPPMPSTVEKKENAGTSNPQSTGSEENSL